MEPRFAERLERAPGRAVAVEEPAGGILAAILVPSRLPAHAPPLAAPEPRPEPSPAGAPPGMTEAGVSGAETARASPIRSFCDPAGPPLHPRGR